jgi:hypothetical protein
VRNEPSDWRITPTIKTTKEKATINTSRRMGKNGKLGKKSQLALAAKKCRLIGNYLVRKISATSVKYPPTESPPPERHTDLLPTQSEDDGDKACKASDVPATNSSSSSVATTINDENAPPNEMRAIDDLRGGFLPLGKQRRLFVGTKMTRISGSVAVVVATVPAETTVTSAVAISDGNNSLESLTATRSVSTASTTFFAANATTTRSMLKDRTEVFEGVVNDRMSKRSPSADNDNRDRFHFPRLSPLNDAHTLSILHFIFPPQHNTTMPTTMTESSSCEKCHLRRIFEESLDLQNLWSFQITKKNCMAFLHSSLA